jgi:hypothetical protein
MIFGGFESALLSIWKWFLVYGIGNITCFCLGRTAVVLYKWTREDRRGITNKVIQVGCCLQCRKIVIKSYDLLSPTRRTQIWAADDRVKIPNCSYHNLTIKRVVRYWLMK